MSAIFQDWNNYTFYNPCSYLRAGIFSFRSCLFGIRWYNCRIGEWEYENKIKACDIEKFSTYIQKTQAIITELQVSLDMEKGGEIAKNLMSLYIYFNSELVNISFSHSKEKISFVLNMLNELLDAWKQAANTTATNAPATPVSSALNIEG